jgi:low affinity Fe/Cu permease
MGVWWAAVTMTTVGYGDATPKTPSGRGVALVWMFVGVVAVAIFTAAVTSILTVSSMQSTLKRASDIDHLRLGAIADASGAWYLTRHHLSFKPYEDDESALTGLAHHEVDAVVANIASLRYLVSRQWQGILRVSPIVLEPIVYAIGLPTDSPLREVIDRTLLRTIEQERWQDVTQYRRGVAPRRAASGLLLAEARAGLRRKAGVRPFLADDDHRRTLVTSGDADRVLDAVQSRDPRALDRRLDVILRQHRRGRTGSIEIESPARQRRLHSLSLALLEHLLLRGTAHCDCAQHGYDR